ncbi:MAG: glycosyltransferase [Cyanobacteriota bacterium]|nr:glycosyltransferase [Cyanobacteriota bacterium]
MSTDSTVSVVIASDFESTEKSWQDERACLTSFKNQDFPEKFEIILAVNEAFKDKIPPDLCQIAPEVKIYCFPVQRSSELKDLGVQKAIGQFIAVVEADCIASPNWLRCLVQVLENHPDVAIASGRTIYGFESMLKRSLSLLDRAFMDTGKLGWVGHVCNNGALYRREILNQFPYPKQDNPFISARVRNQKMVQQGYKFFFVPEAIMQHAFGGWDFLCDERRNIGHGDVILYNPNCIPWKRPIVAIKLLLKRLKNEFGDCTRVGKNYLLWYDWPVAIGLLVALRFLEIPGMMDAFNGSSKPRKTSYT